MIVLYFDFKDVAVYDNSLQEWAAEPANPMETGTE
jgi:3-mercaptopyruvate sulfurtransferase SseA